MSGSLWARLKRLEEKRGLAGERGLVCPVCGLFPARIRFEGVPDEEPCETCERLQAATPEEERPPFEVIEFRDNTRSREEIERERAIRAIREEHDVD